MLLTKVIMVFPVKEITTIKVSKELNLIPGKMKKLLGTLFKYVFD